MKVAITNNIIGIGTSNTVQCNSTRVTTITNSKAVNDAINTYGLIKVLRQGFSYRGIKFKIVYFKPESSLNENLWTLYNKNILTCTRQFHYSTDNNNSLDMVPFEKCLLNQNIAS